jgi:hypothetical protein
MIKKRISKLCIGLLGIYQIAGGLFGLQAVFKQSITFILIHLFSYTIVIGFFVFSICSGIYLIRNKDLAKGIKLSFINQIIQLIQFEIVGNGLYFVAGSYIALKFTFLPNFSLQLDYSLFRSYSFISFLVNSSIIYVSINIISVILIIFLQYIYHQHTSNFAAINRELNS